MDIKKKDVIWVYLARFFSLGVNVILLPIILAYLTDKELGLWYVFASISQIVNLFDFGFNATISRHMTYAWSGVGELKRYRVDEVSIQGHNEHLMAVVVRTCRIVYIFIALAAALVMLTIGTIYVYEILDHQFLIVYCYSWCIYILGVFINLLYGYWASLLQGIGAIAERNKMVVYSKLIQLMLAFLFLYLGWGLLGFVIAFAISGIFLGRKGRLYFTKKTYYLNIKDKVDVYEIKECLGIIWATAWKDGLVMIAQYFSTQANTLICAYYIDLTTTSSYGIITQITSVLASVSMAYFSAYQPKCSSSYLKKDKTELKEIVCSSVFVYKLIYIVGVISFVIIGIPVLRFVRPNMDIDFEMLILIVVFYYLYYQHCLFASIIASSNELPFYKAFVISAVFSFTVSILLVKKFDWGTIGLVAGQLIVNLMYNDWKWPLYTLKMINLNILDIYRKGGKLVYNELKGFIINK